MHKYNATVKQTENIKLHLSSFGIKPQQFCGEITGSWIHFVIHRTACIEKQLVLDHKNQSVPRRDEIGFQSRLLQGWLL